MSAHASKIRTEDIETVHQFYMQIINAMPSSVYWVDKECNLKGCNSNFKNLLGLQTLKDFNGSPYEKMIELGHWDNNRVKELKLDDMSVLFSGKAIRHSEEKLIRNGKGKELYFQITRAPIYDKNKEVIGLVVTLTDVTLSKSIQVPKKQKSKEESSGLKAGHLPTVLLVEDNIIAQNVETALFTSLQCKVDIAETADIAVKLFHPGKYDVVLMDIGLEDSSGYIVAKQLRQKEKEMQHQHVPIIALTGYEADVVKYDCQHYFMEGAITKPLTSEQAEQIIKHYVYHMDVPVRGLKSI